MTGEAPSGWADVSWGETSYVVRVPDAETDYIQGRLSREGRPYEEGLLADLAARLTPDDRVVDVGANVGNHSLFLACAVGCRVEAFEPDAHLVQAIRESVERNGVESLVRIHPVAVGATRGEGMLVSEDPSNLGGQRVLAAAPSGDSDAAGEERAQGQAAVPQAARVDIVALDDVDLGRPVSLIKIDVEGVESDVLRGAEELLKRDRPVVVVECLQNTDFELIESILGDLGYVWIGVWNASPTHGFVHVEHIGRYPLLRERLRDVALALADTQQQARADRQRLDQVNLQYRALAQAASAPGRSKVDEVDVVLSTAEATHLQLDRLASQLASTRTELSRRIDGSSARDALVEQELHRRLAEATAERDRAEERAHRLARESDRLGAAVADAAKREESLVKDAAEWQRRAAHFERAADDAERRVADEMQSLATLRAALVEKDLHAERVRRDLKVVRRYIAEQDAAATVRDELAARIGLLEAQLAAAQAEASARTTRLQAERDTYRRTLIGLRQSTTYLIGAALRDAARSPRGLLRLIPQLRRAFKAGKEPSA